MQPRVAGAGDGGQGTVDDREDEEDLPGKACPDDLRRGVILHEALCQRIHRSEEEEGRQHQEDALAGGGVGRGRHRASLVLGGP